MGEELTPRGGGGSAAAWAALQQAPNMGPATMLRLARVFGSPEGALGASADELVARGRLTTKQAEAIRWQGETRSAIEREIEDWRARGIGLVAMGEGAYPPGLADLRTPPPLLYVRGSLRPEDGRAVAIVGTRSPDRRGSSLARQLGRELANRGFAVVSGLARGIDTAAHRGALQVARGRTIAVLGCGLLRVYPPENGVLAKSIAERGCLISEVPPDTEVAAKYLLMRDRIQAALSRAVIVVQAHGECGSIVTARHAVRCGRLLYGVPWETPPFSEGWRTLRSLGARPITAETDLDEVARETDAHEGRQRGLM
ncbi:MAG: DNA-processing protein DprA [Armatimonadota bacterium]